MFRGTSVNHNHLPPVTEGINSVTPETAFKLSTVRPSNITWNFSPGKKVQSWALESDLRLRGNCLLWHLDIPVWIKSATPQRRRAILRRYIYRVVEEFPQVQAWDVINEAFADNGSLRPYWQNNPCTLKEAFHWAHEANPEAKLFYNDYRPCSIDKWKAILEFLADLKSSKTPIHGIGIQHHYHLRKYIVEAVNNWQSTRWVVEEAQHLGLEVEFTEVSVIDDLDLPWMERRAISDLYAIARKLSVTGFTLWQGKLYP